MSNKMDKSIILSEPETVDFKGLRYVSLRLLWDCNLRCIMCDHPHRARNEMSLETAQQTLDQLTHPVRLTFIGGEPCLWLMRYPQVLRRAINDGHVVHMITNGLLLERLPDFVNAFRDRSVSVQFSIDGFEKTYEGIRKRSSWAAVVKAIRLLQAKRTEGNNKQAFITAGYLLMRSTLADLPQFVRFCAREGLDSISLTYIMIYDSMVQRGEINLEESVYFHQEETNEAVNMAIEIAQKEGISISFPPPLGAPSAFGRRWSGPVKASLAPGPALLPPHENLACDKPWKEIFVNQDGTIVPCCCGPGVGPVIGHLSDGIQNLWNSAQVKSVRKSLSEGEFHKQCRCGINITAVGRQGEAKFFFTQIQGITL
jgi:MoaA/NifB/PqqE/SkfB family radical SAM enzyme